MLNHIDIMGRLVREPEYRTTTKGTAVATFTLAVDRDFNREETDFVDCIAWSGTADFVSKYIHKGSMAVVSGRLQSDKWTDKEEKKHTSWNVRVDNVYFGKSKRDATPQIKEIEDDSGELPF